MNKTLDEYIEALRLHSNCDAVNCQSFNCGACKFALAIENVPTDREVLKYFEELKTLRVELEKNSKELEVYKKATTFLSDYIACSYRCDLCGFQKECNDDRTITSCSEFIRTMLLKKAREENERMD